MSKKILCGLITFCCIYLLDATELAYGLEQLKAAYPDHIKEVTQAYILWADGVCMATRENVPSLADQLEQPRYISGVPTTAPQDDPGRVRYEPFFCKMYGSSPKEVDSHLEKVAWMPHIFGEEMYMLPVTRIHNIHEKIKQISVELEELVVEHPDYIEFLRNPGGTFCWRKIANTDRQSAHSWGMTLDINAEKSEYWQWDLKAQGIPISEEAALAYRNTVPWEIVEIFEKHGFVWGGKWYHYDTMHFEYRPELFD